MAQTPMYAAMANSPGTELSADISVSNTTIAVLDASKLPDAPNLLTVGSDDTAETILYTGKSGNSLTGCTRGFNGTTAKGWSTGAKVARNFTGYDHDTFIANIEDLDQRMSDAVTLDQVQEVAAAAKQAANSYTDTKVEFLEAEIDQKLNGNMLGIEREVANLNLQLEASKRVQNGVTFGTEFRNGSTFNMNMDMTKTFSTMALAKGATSITVDDIAGLSEGMEVTVFDDVNIERVVIQSISGNVLTVPALANAYKEKANIARTMAVIDLFDNSLKFGSWGASSTQTIHQKIIINTNNGGNSFGGRKITRLSNGWLVVLGFVSSPTPTLYFYVSKDNGNTWSELCYVTQGTPRNGASLCSKGTMVYMVYNANGVIPRWCQFDALTVQDVAINSTVLDSNVGYCSNPVVCKSEDGNSIHAAYIMKNTPSDTFYNIRYCRGTINNTGSVTWGTPEQITQLSNGQPGFTSITTVNNEAVISFILDFSSTTYQLIGMKKTGFPVQPTTQMLWTYAVMKSDSYVINAQQITYIPPSVSGLTNGRIIVSFVSTDASITNRFNIFVIYSDNLGINWSSQRITSNTLSNLSNTTITFDKNNKVYVMFFGVLDGQAGNTNSIGMVTNPNGGTINQWTPQEVIENSVSTTNFSYPGTFIDLSLDMTIPPFTFNGTNSVLFSGTWKVENNVPILENDVRFTLKDTDEVATWVKRDANLTLNAQFNGQDMDKTTVDNEDQFVKSITAAAPAEVRLRMTRPTINDDLKITRILGGVN